MTDPLDDIYAKPSVEYFPPTLVANWLELEPGYSSVAGFNSPGSLSQLGQQIGPDGFTLTHSMDDGLPDPVTATGSFEASASFSMDLVGRQGATAAAGTLALGANSTTGVGTGVTVSPTYPSGLGFWDYVLVAITVDNASEVVETSMDPESFQTWRLLGDSTNVVSGTTYRTWVFGRRHFTSGVVAPAFTIGTSGNYGWVVGSITCPKTAGFSAIVGVGPRDVAESIETVSRTAHTQDPATISNRGWTVGVFGTGSGAGPWTSAGNTILGQSTGGSIATAIIASPLRLSPDDYVLTANTNSATQNVAMVHLAMEVRDYQTMDAAGYFSPLNTDSPIATFERDTAPLTLAINNIRTDGLGVVNGAQVSTVIYRGLMAGIAINGDRATVSGVSKTRLLLDDSKLLPAINGLREGLTTDWLAHWLLAQGGQYTSIAPSIYTRWWAACHGSMHPDMDGSAGYAASYERRPEWGVDITRGNTKFPSTDGPFVTAIYGEQSTSRHIENIWLNDQKWETEVPGIQEPLKADILTQKNSVGRFTFWVRGDSFDSAPSSMLSNSGQWPPIRITLFHNDIAGSLVNYVRFIIRTDRQPEMRLGSDVVTLTGFPLPEDGQWHFFSFMFDYDNGTAKIRMDNIIWNTTHASAAAETLPNSDADWEAAGGVTKLDIRARLPIAEIQLESGMPYSDDWTRFWPTPTTPSLNATYRPTKQPLAAISNPTPVQGWSTLQSLAQSTLSHLRIDESDNAMLVPLSYFGEDEQMTVETLNVLDTNWNASKVGLNVDATKTRNVVTTEFQDTRIDSVRSPILSYSSSLAIPRGVTTIRFSLDELTVETHGGAQKWTPASSFTKLTDNQINGVDPVPNDNTMTVNTMPDGSGTTFTSSSFTARISDWSASSIDVEFTNNYSATLYLANSGANVPFLQALGYVAKANAGYSTVSDLGSIRSRQQRALTTQVDWIHDRATADQFGSTLVGILAQPSQEIVVTVTGDPRRVPGKLCQLIDSTGTRASGTWRINQIVHRGNGPMYLQDLSLVRVGDLGDWDESNWDDAVWG